MIFKFQERLEGDPRRKELFGLITDELNNSDLQSMLIEAFRFRSSKSSPSRVLREYRDSRFYPASEIPQAVYQQFDLLAFSLLPGDFHSLDLSPVTPLGTCTSMSNLSQNLILSTIRNSEVIADPTNTMALQSALLRESALKKDPKSTQTIHCCSSHRVLRTQCFKEEKFSAHFRVFSMVSAGRDSGNFAWEMEQLEKHVRFYLVLCEKLKLLDKTEVQVSDFTGEFKTSLIEEMFGRLAGTYKEAEFKQVHDRAEARNYYTPLAFRIRFSGPDGATWDIVDGGFTNWTQLLLNSRKERFLSSAIGSELLFRVYPGIQNSLD